MNQFSAHDAINKLDVAELEKFLGFLVMKKNQKKLQSILLKREKQKILKQKI